MTARSMTAQSWWGAELLDHGAHDGHPQVDLVEIEAVLRAHEQITDAVVLGVDPIETHVASAADLDQSELNAWCRRFLGDGAPAHYHVVRERPVPPTAKSCATAPGCSSTGGPHSGPPRVTGRDDG
ncbi:MAG: hypothetical protein ACRDSP_12390 [Pseudonocardiaceae bacterium]